MFTKNDYARYIIKEFRTGNPALTKDIPDEKLESLIYSSTSLGIALQQLSLIKEKENNDYLNERGGLMYVLEDSKNVKTMSVREFMSLLPDEIVIEFDENGCMITKHIFHKHSDV